MSVGFRYCMWRHHKRRATIDNKDCFWGVLTYADPGFLGQPTPPLHSPHAQPVEPLTGSTPIFMIVFRYTVAYCIAYHKYIYIHLCIYIDMRWYWYCSRHPVPENLHIYRLYPMKDICKIKKLKWIHRNVGMKGIKRKCSRLALPLAEVLKK